MIQLLFQINGMLKDSHSYLNSGFICQSFPLCGDIFSSLLLAERCMYVYDVHLIECKLARQIFLGHQEAFQERRECLV